ncbi:MAG: enoyl-CoA hydratase/isomerase family protein [Isosphaeraceae bacterium]
MTAPLVLREDQGTVAVLILNRPSVRNALSRGLVTVLSDALSAVEAEVGTRSVILTGAGDVFCSGMDLKEGESAGRNAESEVRAIAAAQGIADLIDQIHRMKKPSVAALNGDAHAGGAGLATACDFIVAADSARIGYPEVKRGLVAAMVMHDLVRQVGTRRARELLLSGEPITAEVAERWGLVNRVVPRERCRGEAIALAQALSACGPEAIATTKRLLDEVSGRPGDLRGAAAVTAAIRVSDEALEGMRAFLEKRPAAWARLEERENP